MSENNDYFESLQLFYSERLKSSLKPKFSKCKGCSEKKQFVVEEGKLYYTCGSSTGLCGKQLEINLAQYMYYPGVKETSNNLINLLNKTNHPDIYTAKEIKEYESFISDTDKILKEATKEFTKINNLDERLRIIQKTSKDRINMKKEQNLLMGRFTEEVDITKKQNLIKDYIRLNQQLQEEYFTMNDMCGKIENHILIEQGTVNRESNEEGIEESPNEIPTEKWKLKIREISKADAIDIIRGKLDSVELIGILLNHFLKSDTLKKSEYNSIKGKYTSTWINIIKSLQITGDKKIDSHNWLANIQYHLNSSIIEKADKSSSIIRITEPWKKILKEAKPNQSLGEPINKTLLPELQGLVKGDNNNMTMNVIVAYRDPGDGSRKEQLRIFKEQMNLIFKDQTDIQFYIIEQETARPDYGLLPELIKQPNSDMAKFNLGLLKNIGFELASKKKSKKKDYFILTDVDLLPSMNLVEEYLKYPKNPIHLANKGTRYNMDGKDANFLGGVISVSDKDFRKANGYPNNFWGWGGEDNALNRRFRDNHLRVEKPNEHVIDLEKLDLKEKLTKLKVDQTKELRKREKLDEDRSNWSQNGLSNIKDKFKITKKLKAKNITHVKVFLNVESDITLEEEEEEDPTYAPGSPPPLREDEPDDK